MEAYPDPARTSSQMSKDCEAYAQRDTNKRSHGERQVQFGRFQPHFNHKAQSHSLRDTPQRSQSLEHINTLDASVSTNNDRMPSLTGSSCSSNDKSASPEDITSTQVESDEQPDERLPMLENAIFRINLHFPERDGEVPCLPSLGDDKVVQAAFETEPHNGPHNGRYHGLNSSVYREDQAWRKNPGDVNRLREHIAHEEAMAKIEEQRRVSVGSVVSNGSSDISGEFKHNNNSWVNSRVPSVSGPSPSEPRRLSEPQITVQVANRPVLPAVSIPAQIPVYTADPVYANNNGPYYDHDSNGSNGSLQKPTGGGATYNQNIESSSDRPFKCTFEDCDWSFSRSSDQKRHIRSHNKPLLQCPYWEHNSSCHRNGGGFNRLDVLKRHLRLMHFDLQYKESGSCKHCREPFSSIKAFIDHCQSCASELSTNSNTASDAQA